MTYINCEHPIDQIRIVWSIQRNGSIQYAEIKIAHCILCNSHLPLSEEHAKLAIDLVMIAAARKEEHRVINSGKQDTQ